MEAKETIFEEIVEQAKKKRKLQWA